MNKARRPYDGSGDNGDLIRFLMSGEASVMLRDGDDQALTVESLQPGDVGGELPYGNPTPLNSKLVADEPCSVLEVSENSGKSSRKIQEREFCLVKNLARKIMRLDRMVYKANKGSGTFVFD